MTMLYRLDAAAADVAGAFGAEAGPDPWSGGYVAPGCFAPVITAGREFVAGPRQPGQPRRLVPRLWGVPPPPRAAAEGRGAIASVRNPDSPFWVGNLRNSEFRCVIPATAFMEWSDAIDVEGRRIRHWFTGAGGSFLALAGVWKDSEVPSFALVTCRANALLRGIGRETMPVVLADRAAIEGWLHAGWDRAARLIAPCREDCLRMNAEE
ncbi:SOS response-associated peptidase family protein [Tsuneonella sp. HG222]